MTEKFSPIERALVAAASMPAPQARNVLMLICESGMRLAKPAPQPESPGAIHYARREKFIKRMKGAADRVLNYARHETLRNCEKHFRDSAMAAAEETTPTTARIAFDKTLFGEELIAALREESQAAIQTAGQQLYDEIGKDDPFTIPAEQALKFLDTRENLLANAPDEIHAEVMNAIQAGLEAGDTKRELMSRIGQAFDGISEGRADVIANTETAAAFNFARDKAMRKAGITHKKWLHSQSPLIQEPRPTHVEADGQVVPYDEPFDVGGVQFMHPADDSLGAGPEDIINCHCVAIPVEAP
jgi:uncharacterized protein with gpF-like domain